ncbi:cupin domain-containing protein, partial [Nocardia brasiliensis]|uniref:cupin domain-containing protein n=1 Tax=Nocardia brasiliensis TaxID=37326 RepID=UPI0024583F92
MVTSRKAEAGRSVRAGRAAGFSTNTGAPSRGAAPPHKKRDRTARPGEPREVDGSGVRTVLLCGAYELGRQRSHPLLDEMPEFIHIPA